MTHAELEVAVRSLAALVVSMNGLLHETTCHVDAMQALLTQPPEQPTIAEKDFVAVLSHLQAERAKLREKLLEQEWLSRLLAGADPRKTH